MGAQAMPAKLSNALENMRDTIVLPNCTSWLEGLDALLSLYRTEEMLGQLYLSFHEPNHKAGASG